jgi:protein NrfC
VKACRYDALWCDPEFGNVRIVHKSKCVGCGACEQACPFTPARARLADDEGYGGRTSRKCDLCATAPYHWSAEGGGPSGSQACVAVCPVGAIAFTESVPEQQGDAGYRVDLRGPAWAALGYPKN